MDTFTQHTDQDDGTGAQPQSEESDSPMRGALGALGKIADRAKTVARESVEARSGSLGAVQDAYDRGMKAIFLRECPVNAFMLPTGPEADDYLLMFDLDEFMANLRNDIFMRPAIALWASTAEGHDPQRLARELAARFAEEFGEAMEQTTENSASAVRELKAAEDASLQGLDVWVVWAGLTVFTAGILPGILWGLGIRPSTSIFGTLNRYMRIRVSRAATERQVLSEIRKMERDFKNRQKAFEQAVGQMEIREHPRLQVAAAALRGEDTPANDDAVGAAELPNVDRFLEHPAYRQASDAARARKDEPPLGGGVGRFFRELFRSG